MTISKRLFWLAGLVAVIAMAVAVVTLASPGGSAQDSPQAAADDGDGADDNGSADGAGKLDDGKDLLPQAAITVEDAIAAAQAAYSGNIGEIDLEYHDGTLVFNVDVGDRDVKVDAATGDVLGAGKD